MGRCDLLGLQSFESGFLVGREDPEWRLLRPSFFPHDVLHGPPSDEIYSDEKDAYGSQFRNPSGKSRGIRQAAQNSVELEAGNRQLSYLCSFNIVIPSLKIQKHPSIKSWYHQGKPSPVTFFTQPQPAQHQVPSLYPA
jgi:hypothetical protein